MSKNIKIVIGANFGDEGKGQMTDYFCDQTKDQKTIVVCHNGSAQKGHTVERNGIRHVFHHFGSGTFTGADTYLAKEYVVNPIFFRQEWEELNNLGFPVRTFVHPDCRIAVPQDMMINQMIEEKRGKARHGSCGYGFFEAILRNVRIPTLVLDSKTSDFTSILKKISDDYVPRRLEELGISKLDEEFLALIQDSEIWESFLEDLHFFYDHVTIQKDEILKEYDSIVFEGAQGLLLDQDNLEYFPHLTPSHTGLRNPYEILEGLGMRDPVEVCYITRSYLTRHGAGRLDRECKKEEINAEIRDLTNVPNPFQETLRYGKLDRKELQERIEKDFSLVSDREPYHLTVALMHLNEYPIEPWESVKYQSYGKTGGDVFCHQN